MSNYIDSLKWRYATKKFDKNKKLSPEQVSDIKDILRLTASSYGLQPYRFLIISNDELKEKLKAASYNQDQITDSSHLVVFCSRYDFDESGVDEHVKNTADALGKNPEDLEKMGAPMKAKVNKMNDAEKAAWTAKQVYIALGNLLSGAAHLKIDACPMEGFEPDKYDEILSLKEKGLQANVLATLGFRDESDKYAKNPKVRRSHDDLFIELD